MYFIFVSGSKEVKIVRFAAELGKKKQLLLHHQTAPVVP